MTVSVNEVEATWIVLTLAGFLLTVFALGDAYRGLRASQADVTASHEVRELTARGNVRRELLRLVIQSLLLGLAIPSIFSDRPITLTPGLIVLMLVPTILLVSTIFDTWDRGRLAHQLVVMVKADRDAFALEASVQENIELTKHVGQQAVAAYEEANTVNQKIARLTTLVAGKEDKA